MGKAAPDEMSLKLTPTVGEYPDRAPLSPAATTWLCTFLGIAGRGFPETEFLMP
jgi:hypothetical protein